MILPAQIVRTTGEGLVVFVPASAAEQKFIHEHCTAPVIEFPDNRCVSRQQQCKAHVLLGYLAMWSGYTPLEVEKAITKEIFRQAKPSIVEDTFSLADCSMETARDYITYLIDLCLMNGVECGEPLWKMAEDLPKYTWACLMTHRCAVCGRKNELHHVDAVGSGRSRKEICHIGMRVLPLCREHHMEIHRVGRDSFLKRYILEPVRVDEAIAHEYKLKG